MSIQRSEYLKSKLFSYQGNISIGISVVMAIASFFAQLGLLATIAIAIVTLLLVFIATELFEYTFFLASHRSHVLTLDKFSDAGFEEYYPEFTEINFREELRHSSALKIVSIYSSTLLTHNYDSFKSFLKTPGRVLEVVLLKPDPTLEAYVYLRGRFAHADPNQLRNSVLAFKAELIRLKGELDLEFPQGHGEIRLKYSKMIPQYSLILFDHVGYLTLYKNAKGRSTNIPAFKIRDKQASSAFSFLASDYRDLVADADYVTDEAL